MKIKIHHLNRNKEKIGIKEIDLTKYQKIGATGSGIAFKPKKGKTIEAYFESNFKDWYLRNQEINEDGVKNKTYHYDLIDKNLSNTPKNRKRDNKGRPIRIFTEYEDIYKEYNVEKWWFFDDETWTLIKKYLKKNNIKFWTYYGDEWIDD